MHHLLVLCLFAGSAVSLYTSCGSDAKFNSGNGKSTSNATNGYTGQKIENLTWFWQCDSAPATLPETAGGNVVVSGPGEHKFKPSSFDKTPLIFSGKICPPVTLPRDIVFVIDVSGSMGGTGGADPALNKSCGRLKAVESIIDDIVSRGGDARFGIVTFSTGVTARSSTMFGDRTNLFTDLSGSGSISDALCRAVGGTEYGAGLKAAESILSAGRSDAIKELYFVSDGEPEDTTGPALAARFKSPGLSIAGKSIPVTIGTAMLGSGNDSILKNDIASKDISGAPLHVGSVQAGNLASTLSKLAANEILEGLMKYRVVGVDDWTEINFTPSIINYNFSVPSITIDRTIAPAGLEVKFEYRDQHNNKYASEGKILWLDGTDKKAAPPATK